MLACLVLAFVFVTIGANLFLKSDGVQARLRQGTEASLGVPIEIGGVTFSIFGGITLHDIRTAENRPRAAQSFEADALRIRFAWLPLLRSQLVITSIELVRPVMIVPENQPVMLLPPEGRVEVQLPEDARESALAGTKDARAGQEEPGKKAPGFVIDVQRFHVEDGEVQLRTARGSQRVRITGLDIETRIHGMDKVSGIFKAETAEIPSVLVLNNITAPFNRENRRISFDNIQADWAGGRVTGEAVVSEETGGFEVDLSIAAVQIPRLLQDAGLGTGRTSGFVEGAFSLNGSGNADSLQGTGEFFLREATLEPLDFMKQVGQLLRIEELQLLALREALLRVSVQNGTVDLSELRLVTENLIILSQGQVGVQAGELDLQSRLLVNDELQRSLGGLISGFLQESDTEGYRELPFRIHGPIMRPRTDLLERLGMGRVTGEVGRFLQNLLGAPQPTPRGENE